MRLGLSSYTYPWGVGVSGHPPRAPIDPLELCRRAVALGVRVVQFADNLPLTCLTPNALKDVQAFVGSASLAVEMGTRGILDGNLSGHLALAQQFRSPFVRLVLDGPGHEPTPEEAVRLLRPHVERFADAGIQLAIENHDRFSAATLVQIIERLGPGHVGITLDTVNSFGALEGLEHVIRVLAPHALNLHLKDFAVRRVPSQMGFVIEGRPLGEGQLDIPWLLGELNRLNPCVRDVNAIIELWTPPSATLDETLEREAAWAEQSVRNARRLIHE